MHSPRSVGHSLLALVLAFQLAVLPGCTSAPVERKPAETSDIGDQEAKALFGSALASIQTSGWGAFDGATGAAIVTRDALEKIQASESQAANILLARKDAPFVVQVLTKKPSPESGFTMVVSTYLLKGNPDLGHITTKELGLGPSNLKTTERFDMRSYAKGEDLLLDLRGISERVHNSMAKNTRWASDHTDVKVGVASTIIAVATLFFLAAPIVASFGNSMPSKGTIVTAVVFAALAIFATSYGIHKYAEAKDRKLREALK